MKAYRTTLWMAAGLAVCMLACGQDTEPTRGPTSTLGGSGATVAPAAPANHAAQSATFPAASSLQPPSTDVLQGIPAYELVVT